MIGRNYNLYYSVWCTNEHELYDLTTDPYQINNIHPSSPLADPNAKLLGVPVSKLLARLDSLIMVLKT